MKKIILTVLGSLFIFTTSFAADADGTWDVSLQSAEGGGQNELVVKTDGETATAKYASQDLKGTFKDGVLDIKGDFYVDMAGMSAELHLVANVEGDTMTGSGTWDGFELSLMGTRK